MSDVDGYLKRARLNYDTLTQDPANLAHADQGAAMWRKAFEEAGLSLDATTAKAVIYALGLTGRRAANMLERGDVVEYACAEASTYLVPAMGGDEIQLDDMPDVGAGERVYFDIEINPADVARWAKRAGFALWAATALVLWRRDRA